MKLIFLTLILASTCICIGQEYFNKIVPSLGQSNQSRLFDSYCDSNFIYVIGDLMDSINTPDNPRVSPWIAKMDFNGEIIKQNILYNIGIDGDIAVQGSRIIEVSREILLYNTIVFDSNDVCHSLVLEIKKTDLSINSYKIFSNPVDSTKGLISGWITNLQGVGNGILLCNLLDFGSYYGNNILLLDSTLNVFKTIVVQDNGRNNFSYYAELNPDSTITIVGDSWKRNDPHPIPDIKPFFMRINLQGEILNFKMANGIPDKAVGFTSNEAYTISKDNYGNWIFNAISLIQTGSCSGCFYMLPYVFSYTSEFETMNWAKCFAENLNDHEQIYSNYASKYDTVDGSYLIVGNRLSDFPNSSYIFKIKDNGDSLWLRHYIPLDWDPDTIIWAILRDIQVTPFGKYLSVGHVSDQKSALWRSWILSIDLHGCIVPGCELEVNTEDVKNSNASYFSIYPNPASAFLTINSKTESTEKFTISLVDLNGLIVRSTRFIPLNGYQYILELPESLNGIYLFCIQDAKGYNVFLEKVYIE